MPSNPRPGLSADHRAVGDRGIALCSSPPAFTAQIVHSPMPLVN
ncbi:hypothetical protein KPSA3_03778 [Pseudomonas syringae pv. actinidiae]|uniref:Uncharacterized protein n=1 Tax=Pseudomonas syringae pv. actinidiae TaxID=103796 RepID=A0AAN4TM42_PSESF|nr:hypothetical protein KPSA3_03778 [Pseudomonas syringae pv. actinidiae]